MSLTAKEIKALRENAGLTQSQMANEFGYNSVRSWQKKEETGTSARSLSYVEEQYFLLITNQHPKKRIVDK